MATTTTAAPFQEFKSFNIRSICKNIEAARAKQKKEKHTNLYARVAAYLKGGIYNVTPEIISDLEKAFEAESKRIRAYFTTSKKQLRAVK